MGGITYRGHELLNLVEHEVRAQSFGKDYGYDIGPAIVPTDAGPVAGYLVVISCRSPGLDPPRLSTGQPVPDGWPTAEMIKDAVGKCLAAIAWERNRLLQAPGPGQN